MTEKEIVLDAYGDVIKNVFITFYGACAENGSVITAEATERFQNGIKFAQQVRDRAIALLAAP